MAGMAASFNGNGGFIIVRSIYDVFANNALKL